MKSKSKSHSQVGTMTGSLLGEYFSRVHSEWLLLYGDWPGAEKWRVHGFLHDNDDDDGVWHFIEQVAYFVPGDILSSWYVLAHSIFIPALSGITFSPFYTCGSWSPQLSLNNLPKTNKEQSWVVTNLTQGPLCHRAMEPHIRQVGLGPDLILCKLSCC